jgi:hypothetical protein
MAPLPLIQISNLSAHLTRGVASSSKPLKHVIVARSQLGDIFTLPVILGIIAVIIVLIGLGSFINICKTQDPHAPTMAR